MARTRRCETKTDRHLDVVAKSLVAGPDAPCALPSGASAVHRLEVTSWSELAVDVHVLSALRAGPAHFPGPASDWTLTATIDGQDLDPYADERDLAHPPNATAAAAGPAVQTLAVTLKHWPSGGGENTDVPPVHHHLKLR